MGVICGLMARSWRSAKKVSALKISTLAGRGKDSPKLPILQSWPSLQVLPVLSKLSMSLQQSPIFAVGAGSVPEPNWCSAMPAISMGQGIFSTPKPA